MMGMIVAVSTSLTHAGSDWISASNGPTNQARCPGEVFADNWQAIWHHAFIGGIDPDGSIALVKNGIVVIESAPGVFEGLDLQSGNSLWSSSLAGAGSTWGPGCIAGSRVFEVRNDVSPQQIYCLDLTTGANQWASPWDTASVGYIGNLQPIDAAVHPSGRDQVLFVVNDSGPFGYSPRVVMLDADGATPTIVAGPSYPGGNWIPQAATPAVDVQRLNAFFHHTAPVPPNSRLGSTSVDVVDASGLSNPPLSSPSAPFAANPALSGMTYIQNNNEPTCSFVVSHNNTRGFIVDSFGMLFGYDLTTGTPLAWSPIQVSTISPNCSIAVLDSPQADLVVVIDPNVDSVSAYHVATGAVAWTTSLPGPRYPDKFCVLDNDTMLLDIAAWPVQTSEFRALDATGVLSNPVPGYPVGTRTLIASNGLFLTANTSPSGDLVCSRPCPVTIYCTAKANSQLCTPTIGFDGGPSVTLASPFNITASQMLNKKFGLLFYSFQPSGAPFQGGVLCCHLPIRRTSVQDSGGSVSGTDCTGTYSFDFNALIQSGFDPNLVMGTVVCAQYWARDPQDLSGFGTSLTDAVTFPIYP